MTGIEAARGLLPFWVVWGPLLFTVPLAFLVALVFSRLGVALALRPLRRAGEASWVERARLAYPAARVAGTAPLLLASILGGLYWVTGGSLSPVPPRAVAVLVALAAFAGARLTARWAYRRLLGRRPLMGESLRGVAAFWLGPGGALLVFAAAVLCMPPRLDGRAAAVLAGAAVGVAFFGVGGGYLLGPLIGLTRPASDRLQAAVDRAAGRTGVRPRAVYEVSLAVANAWAMPFFRVLVFTPRAVAALPDEELEVVAVHELAHLSEPWPVRLGRTLPLLASLPLLATVPLINTVGLLGVLPPLAFAVVALYFVGWLSRRMERRADQAGRAGEAEAGVYARALARLHEANLAPVVMPGRGGSHPHLYDRLVAAGVPPEYERPRPPARWRVLLGLGVAVALPVLLVLTAAVGCAVLMARQDHRAQLTALALGGGNSASLSALAVRRFHHDLGEAAILFRAAGEIDPTSPRHPANEAIALARQGRCDEAQAAAGEAQRRHDAAGRHPGDAHAVQEAWRAVAWCRRRDGGDRP